MKNLLDSFVETFAGRVDYVAYALAGSWLLGMCLNMTAGSPMSLRTAVLGLVGNLIVIAVALAIKVRRSKQ